MRGGLLAGLTGLLALAAGGCSRAAPGGQYHAFGGTVVACDAETGELGVELEEPRRPERDVEACVLNQHTEIYINDRLAHAGEIRSGDRIVVIGYREPNPRVRQFVVSLARVTRSEPEPVLPDFLAAAAARPAAPGAEE